MTDDDDDKKETRRVKSRAVRRPSMNELERLSKIAKNADILTRGVMESPSYQLTKAYQDIPAVRLAAEMDHMHAMSVARHFQDSGMLDALHTFAERQSALVSSVQRLFETAESPGSRLVTSIQNATSSMATAVQALPRFQPETITNLQRISASVSSLDLTRLSNVIDQGFITDIQTVSQRMNDAIGRFQVKTDFPLDRDLSATIRDLMERRLAVQEEILEEQRTIGEEAKGDSLFNRRMAYLNAIFMALTFFLSLAVAIEQWDGEDDDGQGIDPAQLATMQASLETMAEQLEALEQRDVQEAERETAADAELATIMRGIAESLEGEQEAETIASETPDENAPVQSIRPLARPDATD